MAMGAKNYERGYKGTGYVRSLAEDAFGPLKPSEEEVKDYEQGRMDRVRDQLRDKPKS
jgi:hypothetical protein